MLVPSGNAKSSVLRKSKESKGVCSSQHCYGSNTGTVREHQIFGAAEIHTRENKRCVELITLSWFLPSLGSAPEQNIKPDQMTKDQGELFVLPSF